MFRKIALLIVLLVVLVFIISGCFLLFINPVNMVEDEVVSHNTSERHMIISDLTEVSEMPDADCQNHITDMEFTAMAHDWREHKDNEDVPQFKSIFISIGNVVGTPIFDIYYHSDLGTFHRSYDVLKESMSPFGKTIFYYDGELPGMEDDDIKTWDITIFHPDGENCLSVEV